MEAATKRRKKATKAQPDLREATEGLKKALESIAAKQELCLFGFSGAGELFQSGYQHGSNAAYQDCAAIATEGLAAYKRATGA